MTIYWNIDNTPAELHALLTLLGTNYPVRPLSDRQVAREGDVEVAFHRNDEFNTEENRGFTISQQGIGKTITYGARHHAARALGCLLADIVVGDEYEELTEFETLGIMLDCSRNAVMTVPYLKKYLTRLALLGYNMAMLYTEDTYEIPGEEYFGYMRGRYSTAELKELDRFAKKLGIELVGCIQTLGHLEQILRWKDYDPVRDTERVLLIDEEATYQLIEKMILQMKDVFSSRRLHVGMDEAYSVGRGRYLDQGKEWNPYNMLNRHLERVVALCRRHDLQPLIWSDMYFAMGNDAHAMGKDAHQYYNVDNPIPKWVIDDIPREVSLVYWDYYHTEQEFYERMIARHQEMERPLLMASGVWTWSRLWYDHNQTAGTVDPCLAACKKARIKELFFTMWGDDGGYCEYDSALAGLTYAAERIYCGEEISEDDLEKRYQAICHGKYQAKITAGALEGPVPAPAILWDDPLLGIVWNQKALEKPGIWQEVLAHYTQLAENLAPFADDKEGGNNLYALRLCQLLAGKIEIRLALTDAYQKGHHEALKTLKEEIPAFISLLKEVIGMFRAQWLRRNKPFGLERMQVRLVGLQARYEELALRLEEYLTGEIDVIHELEDIPSTPLSGLRGTYHNVASGSVIL